MQKTIAIIPLILFCNLVFSQLAVDSNWSEKVKSVYLSSDAEGLERAWIRMGQNNEATSQLLLRFDLLDAQPDDLRYRIRHCNADWTIDELQADEFFVGNAEGIITNYQPSFTTLKDYINYYQQVPEPYGRFMASGNYVIEVFPADEPDSILFTRRFMVYESIVDIEMTIGKPTGGHGNINRDQEVNLSIRPTRNSFLQSQPDYYTVVVEQNGRNDNRRRLPFFGYSSDAMQYAWHEENVYAAGNHFRYFDLSNLHANMYHVQRIERVGDDIVAFLQPDENRSGKAYTQYNSLNGGMKTNIRDRENPHVEADYVWVVFSLPMQRPFLDGTIHIVGELTQWGLDDESRMEWNSNYRAYTKSMLLKQGYYSYQLLFRPAGGGEASTSTIEGDHYATPNEYTVYIYYRSPGGRYDRLVGIRSATRE